MLSKIQQLSAAKRILDAANTQEPKLSANALFKNETNYILKLLTGKELPIENNKPKNRK
jgi:hypothetical protein